MAHEDLLESLKTAAYDICAIQEPAINSFNNTLANTKWRVVYPKTHFQHPKKTRSVIFVSTAVSTNMWHSLDTDSGDLTAIRLKTDAGTVDIYNIYNDINNDETLHSLARAIQKNSSNEHANHSIWVGDFNRHHPFWEEDRNTHLFAPANLERAQVVLDLASTHDMEMALPKDIPTLCALNSWNLTRPDNVFVSNSLINSLIYCNTEPEKQPVKTDHFPIVTRIDVTVTPSNEMPRFNFRLTDWDQFRNVLTAHLQQIPRPKPITTVDLFDKALSDLTTAAMETINTVVPKVKQTPYAKRWWNGELKAMKKEVTKKGRAAYDKRFNPEHPAHEEYRVLRHKYADAIRSAKLQHWTDWLESLDEGSVWTAGKYANNEPTDASKAKVPNLKGKFRGCDAAVEGTTNTEKSRLFYEAFYPEVPRQGSEESSFTYPPQKWKFTPITDDQITRAIDNMLPYKATAPDTVPNCVLKEAKQLLVPYLGPLFQATFNIGYYPEQWARTLTIVLKKPGKTNYEMPNAWRPISLSNGFARLLNACISNELVNRCEIHDILPKNHFGARPGHSTTQAVHYLAASIKNAWQKRKVVSALFLDVKGAFPSVDISRLQHDMRLRGIPKEYTDWIARRMQGRKTRLSFDDYTSEAFAVENGLDQGDPFSVIGYMIYNSDILEVPDAKNGEDSILFVDDTTLLAIGNNYRETHKALASMLNRSYGVLHWADTHNCTFGIDKFQLVDFLRSKTVTKGREGEGEAINVRGHVVRPTSSAKFLGITVDRLLNWKEQAAAAVAKGEKWLNQFGRLVRMNKGINAHFVRRLYLSVAIPRMLYGADIYLSPLRRHKLTAPRPVPTYSKTTMRQLGTIQRRAMILITGAMRTTASSILNVFAGLLPIHLAVDKWRYNAAITLATIPEKHPLYSLTKRAAQRYVQSHPSPLHELFHTYDVNPKLMEKIKPVRHPSTWKPGITTIIPKSKEEAIRGCRGDKSEIQIFTDGSLTEKGVGAAAVVYSRRRGRGDPVIVQTRLGDACDHTVYEAECSAMALGIFAIKGRKAKTVTLNVDNQAAIMAATDQKQGSGKYIIDVFHEQVEALKKKNRDLKLTIRWAPGHVGIEGNEEADKAAKLAAAGAVSGKKKVPGIFRKALPRSKSAAKQAFNTAVKEAALQAWRMAPQAKKLKGIVSDSTFKNFRKMMAKVDRRTGSIWTQLKTGHVGLNAHLKRLQISETKTCPSCGKFDESVDHFLRHCRAYEEHRKELRRKVKRDMTDIKKLLGNDKNATYAAAFTRKTGRLLWVAGRDQQEKKQGVLYDTRPRQGSRRRGGTGEHGEGGILRWLRQRRGEVGETGVERRVREGRDEAREERRGVREHQAHEHA